MDSIPEIDFRYMTTSDRWDEAADLLQQAFKRIAELETRVKELESIIQP